jgi:hypothetical protein
MRVRANSNHRRDTAQSSVVPGKARDIGAGDCVRLWPDGTRLERLSQSRALLQAVTNAQNCLCPFCLHVSGKFPSSSRCHTAITALLSCEFLMVVESADSNHRGRGLLTSRHVDARSGEQMRHRAPSCDSLPTCARPTGGEIVQRPITLALGSGKESACGRRSATRVHNSGHLPRR